MRKGDLKKQEILNTAEQLFCKNGYEETSVQDILDILKTSKGSFYHHYESKESLLEAMCSFRASSSAAQTAAALKEEKSVTRRLNRVFTGMMPLQGERLSFLLMLLPVFGLPEGRSVQNAYRESLKAAFLKIMTEQIRLVNESGELYCQAPAQNAEICLTLANDVWCRSCEIILENERKGSAADSSRLLEVLGPYRTAIERILSAPFGSIELLNLTELNFLAEQIHVHWKP